MREELRGWLSQLGDPERLLSRAVLGSLTPREAAALRDGLRQVPDILASLACCRTELLADLAAVDNMQDLTAELSRVLVESPPQNVQAGGVIADGVDAELDQARSLARDSKRHIASLEAEEREKTGISSLKIRYNKVFGYYLEVTKANQRLVPDHYIRKQTLVNAERYVTPEVKELEDAILGAEEKQIALEERYFAELRQKIVDAGGRLREVAHALATLDVTAGFAELAVKRRYCRPRMTASGGPITIREGRHPVVEASGSEPFVPNDADLDPEDARIVLLTGPNMGGKSTYLRQVALIVLLAQAGSFVPADSAEIGAVDRIFTRVGASDDLARGESTFMVEMIETSNILHHATAESLVILDEVGRGTATFDGLSLAWAIVEFLHEEGRGKTLFATHYHELTELASLLPRVVNRTLAVKEWEDRIVFLRRVVPGSADKSYGIHVARLAGLPPRVLDRAEEVLGNLEAQEYDLTGTPRLARGKRAPRERAGDGQLALFAPSEEVVLARLRSVDPDRLTPLDALALLHELRARLQA
jgi:DNA mismatch repair protein MutS